MAGADWIIGRWARADLLRSHRSARLRLVWMVSTVLGVGCGDDIGPADAQIVDARSVDGHAEDGDIEDAATNDCESACVHGVCQGGACLCEGGWVGAACTMCPPGSTIEGERCVADDAWRYPGVPFPSDWPFDPAAVERPVAAAWPAAEEPGFYYVAPEHPDATDDPADGEAETPFGRYGYPDRPRRSFPARGWIGDTFEAGTVIVLRGGTYSSENFFGEYSPSFHGTADAPIFLVGDPEEPPRFTDVRLRPYDSRYVVIEHLHWVGGNTGNGALAVGRDRPGPSHHVVLRHLRFANMNYIGGGGAIVGLTATDAEGAELHDIFAYRNVFENCGGGIDWAAQDADHHGYKVDGFVEGNQAYRIWVVENRAVPGPQPDPVDGRFKSLSGNLVQVGDQIAAYGGVHHVYVAGNYQDRARQALAWTKRSHDVIISGNVCESTYALEGGNGQCFGSQYDARWHWSIGNVARMSTVGWQHTSGDNTPGPYFVLGNLFVGMRGAAPEGWRRNAGVSLWNGFGEHVIVGNTFHDVDYGVWARTNASDEAASLQLHNNIVSGVRTDDADGMAFRVGDRYGAATMAHNLFAGRAELLGVPYESAAALNGAPVAEGNLEGEAAYESADDFTPTEDSPAIDNASLMPMGDEDALARFVARYRDDPDYPGDPAALIQWDANGATRAVGSRDIGAVERP